MIDIQLNIKRLHEDIIKSPTTMWFKNIHYTFGVSQIFLLWALKSKLFYITYTRYQLQRSWIYKGYIAFHPFQIRLSAYKLS